MIYKIFEDVLIGLSIAFVGGILWGIICLIMHESKNAFLSFYFSFKMVLCFVVALIVFGVGGELLHEFRDFMLEPLLENPYLYQQYQ